MNALNLKGKNELRADCKAFGIKNYGRMTNDEMRAAIESAQQNAVLVAQYGVCNCPHCGTHLSNGVWDSDSLVQSHIDNGEVKAAKEANEELDAQFWCMACDTCFGEPRVPMNLAPKARKVPESEGLKIEKNREERNGIKRPSVGGVCHAIWKAADEFNAANGRIPKLKEMKALAVQNSWDLTTTSIQYYTWRKFIGVEGRV